MTSRSHAAAPRWPQAARTSDGVEYRIRPITPADAARERKFILRLSPQSRYQRFMHAMSDPSPALIEQFVNVDQRRTMALVAVTGSGEQERIIAAARYAADNDEECEFAVTVADDWQCRGVGTTLTPLLFECAARQGFRTVYGTVLTNNHRMIELAKWLGLTLDPPRRGDTTVRAWRKLEDPRQAAPTWLSAVALVDPGALLLLIAANATPVGVSRLLGKKYATPIDAVFRRRDGKPVFGAHKTWRGLVAGTLACCVIGAFLPCGMWVGLGFGLLALAGDLGSSLVKRRMHWESGHSAPLLDQLPESLLPLILFANQLGLTDASIFGTAALFTLLDLSTVRWRESPARARGR